VIFRSHRLDGARTVNLAWKSADGAGPSETLVTEEELSTLSTPASASPDGTVLLYNRAERTRALLSGWRPVIGRRHHDTSRVPRRETQGALQGAIFQRSTAVGAAGYDVSLDGQRFLMVKPVGQAEATQINVVQNWFEELKRLVPAH
jgi:hypothetical protein